jgi:hypothetical protein
LISLTSLYAVRILGIVKDTLADTMAPSQRTTMNPNDEAQEDDERQYGHGPLSKEELEQKHVSHFKYMFPC